MKFPVKRWTLITLAGLCLGGILAQFHCRQTESDKNLILITLDTQRADYLSCYDPSNAHTPHLDSLAEEGLLFENCYSQIPITLPAHAAMFFSQQPHELSIYNNGEALTGQKNKPAVAEIFRENGYTTAAFVSMGVLEAKYGLDKGYAKYEGDYPQKGRYYASAEEINDLVFPWLNKNSEQKFFLWVHYSDPHAPYHPPYSSPAMTIELNGERLGEYYLNETLYDLEIDLDPGDNLLHFQIENAYRERSKQRHARFRRLELSSPEEEDLILERMEGWMGGSDEDFDSCVSEASLKVKNPKALKKARLKFRGSLALGHAGARELYKKEVEYMDLQIGNLINRLKQQGLYSNTHILVVADHGEGLGEYLKRNQRVHFGHIQYLYDVYLHVPLLIRSPKIKRGRQRIKTHVSLLDIAPTLLGLAGLKSPQHYTGKDVLSPDYPKTQEIFQATYRPEATRNQFGILSYPLHFIFTPEESTYELYDLSSDPLEKTNIYSERGQEDLVIKMKRQLDGEAREILKNRTVPKRDKSTEEMLKALGYIK